MRLNSLSICGFRAFNDAQQLDLSDAVAVFEGPNGCGKTSIGEAVEWLLYGRTLKRTKGDDLSKREYAGCYRNAHYAGAAAPFVEARLDDLSGESRTIRRELRPDETSVLTLDGHVVQDLRAFGIETMYDRPLLLQHTLQDFIFMKPKARYEVLSSMMGLEPLITFRNAVEAARTEFGRRVPQRVTQAQNRRTLLMSELRQEPTLAPAAALIEAGSLAEAKEHLEQIARGLIPPGTPTGADLVSGLKATKAAKERAQLDWGRFSGAVINAPADPTAVRTLETLEARVTTVRQKLSTASETRSPDRARERDPQRREFYQLGLHVLDADHPERCPFCATDSLTPQRIAAIREAVADTPEGQSAIQGALVAVRELKTDLARHISALRGLVPTRPGAEDATKVRALAGVAAEPFLESATNLTARLAACEAAFEKLEQSRHDVEQALASGSVPNAGDDLTQVLAQYKSETNALPASINAYVATYNQLEPTIRTGLASAADVTLLERAISSLEQWKEVRISQASRDIDRGFGDLIADTRAFIATQQKSILASRDEEIRSWYSMLNPVLDVAYDGIVPGTDNLELRAKTFSKTMAAAPNLSTSQLNCLGLAVYLACATRKGSPFKTLLIDDPVQSMDDEHTEAFKKQVIDRLLTDGYHIVVLTHMQLLANDIEGLYRKRGAALYKMSQYSRSGPSIEWKGPEIVRLLDSVRKKKDCNEEYRKEATLDLRMFVERFAKEMFKAQTGGTISKRYEDKAWGELKDLLRRCSAFDANDEPKFEDTHTFTSRHLHSDDRMPQRIPSAAQITAHYKDMSELLEKYKPVLGI